MLIFSQILQELAQYFTYWIIFPFLHLMIVRVYYGTEDETQCSGQL